MLTHKQPPPFRSLRAWVRPQRHSLRHLRPRPLERRRQHHSAAACVQRMVGCGGHRCCMGTHDSKLLTARLPCQLRSGNRRWRQLQRQTNRASPPADCPVFTQRSSETRAARPISPPWHLAPPPAPTAPVRTAPAAGARASPARCRAFLRYAPLTEAAGRAKLRASLIANRATGSGALTHAGQLLVQSANPTSPHIPTHLTCSHQKEGWHRCEAPGLTPGGGTIGGHQALPSANRPWSLSRRTALYHSPTPLAPALAARQHTAARARGAAASRATGRCRSRALKSIRLSAFAVPEGSEGICVKKRELAHRVPAVTSTDAPGLSGCLRVEAARPESQA